MLRSVSTISRRLPPSRLASSTAKQASVGKASARSSGPAFDSDMERALAGLVEVQTVPRGDGLEEVKLRRIPQHLMLPRWSAARWTGFVTAAVATGLVLAVYLEDFMLRKTHEDGGFVTLGEMQDDSQGKPPAAAVSSVPSEKSS